MKDIFTALGLSHKTASAFSLDIEPVKDNIGIRRIINSNIRQLEDIERSFLVDTGRPEYSTVDIDKVINKVKTCTEKKKNNVEWSIRELKLISYYITRFSMIPEQFSYALNMLSMNWKDSFFSGLVYSILNGWTIWKRELRTECTELLKSKLKDYQGRFSKYIKLREHIDFFDDAGPVRVCSLLMAKNMELEQAPEILGLTAPNISLTYFSDVIISFIKTKKSDLDEIKDILCKHTLDRTKKLVLAYLIEEADNSGDTFQQSMLCRRSREIMNYDVTMESTWAAFGGASDKEKVRLKHCHELVTAWYARRSVETFFEIACQDKDRRNFWLKYVYAIHNFKIVGSESVRSMLKSDGRINDALRSCFIESKSRSSQTSALILYIKDKVFVEFSDTGALYVYNTDRKVISKVKGIRYIEKSEDLKQPSIGPLVQQDAGWYGTKWYTHNDEGRLPHSGYWQERLESWMKKIMQLQPKYTQVRKKKSIDNNSSIFKSIEKDSAISIKPSNSVKKVTFRDSSELPRFRFLQILIASRDIINDEICIVATSNGYCLHLIKSWSFIRIDETLRRTTGEIKFKEVDDYGFQEVIHQLNEFIYIIGYIKKEKNRVLFKKKPNLIPYCIDL